MQRSGRLGAREKGMAWVPGGEFLMGSNDFYPEERPVHPVAVDGFWMDEHPVTVAEFHRFVKETGHVTWAERRPIRPTTRMRTPSSWYRVARVPHDTWAGRPDDYRTGGRRSLAPNGAILRARGPPLVVESATR